MRTSSGLDSGFTADRAIGSGWCSVASSAKQPLSVDSDGRDAGCSDLDRFGQRPASNVRPPVRGGGGSEGARLPVMVSVTERELSTRTEFVGTAADNLPRSAGRLACSPTYRPASSLPTRRPVALHASIVIDASSHHATPRTTDPAPSLAATNYFQDCVRLGSLADGANRALNLRAPSLNSVGGPFGLVMLPAPAPESGVARSCSLSSVPSSRTAVSSDLERFAQRPVSKVRPPVRGGCEPERASVTDWFFRAASEWRSICGGSEGARFPVMVSAREAERASSHDLILLRSERGRSICGERELSTRTEFMERPADLHASVFVTVSSFDASRGTVHPSPSISSRADHPPLPALAGESGGHTPASYLVAVPGTVP